MTSQGKQAVQNNQAKLATPFTALGQPQRGMSPNADHRVVNLGADRLGTKPFVT